MSAINSQEWRRNIISPAGSVLPPKRYAIVPAAVISLADAAPEWRECSGPIAMPADAAQTLVLDFGQKLTGHLEFRIEGADALRLELISGPVAALTRFKAALTVPRNERGWRDEYRALRFARFRWNQEPVPGAMLDVKMIFTAYPVQYRGYFHSDSDLYNKTWMTAAYTVQLCMQPHEYSGAYVDKIGPEYGEFAKRWRSPYGQFVVWDGPRRDREVWIGDMWPETMTILYAFGAAEVIRSSLFLVTCIQNEDGSIPGSGLTRQPFAEYACWWVVLMERYFQVTGDKAFIRDMEGPFRKQMAWLRQQLIEQNGWLLIRHRQTWAWTLSRQGVVTGSQCVAYAALKGGAALFRLLGDEASATEFGRMANDLRHKIRTELWNEDLGVFKDSLAPTDGVARFSCDSNSLALLFHVATPTQSARTRAFLRSRLWGPFGTKTIDPIEPREGWNWAHNHNIWPFVVGLELEGRFEWEDFEGADELIRRCWGNMLSHGSECFWEMVDENDGSFVTKQPVADTGIDGDTWNSYSHGWSGGVAYMMQSYVLGIRPLGPGFSRFLVAPRLGKLGHAMGAVPTPQGEIRIAVEKDHVNLEVPEATEAFYSPASGRATEARLYGPGRHVIAVEA